MEAKKVAVERTLSLTRLPRKSLRRSLAEERAERAKKPAFRPVPVIEGARPLVRIDLDDTRALLEL